MTVQEFSDGFDTLLSGFIRSGEFGENLGTLEFDEYEKSLFLTKAQEQLVIALYSGKNTNGDSFESSEEIRRYLKILIVDVIDNNTDDDDHKVSSNSYIYKLPDDLWFIVYEAVNWSSDDLGCLPYKGIQVVPIKHDEYHRIKNNPFRGPTDNRVLRLDGENNDSTGQYVELISKYPIKQYQYRYIKKPRPIVLTTLVDVSVGGVSTPQTSELHEAMHHNILELGTRLAIQSRSYAGNTNNNTNKTTNQ